jgi:uncharacterized protein (DUF305 family)
MDRMNSLRIPLATVLLLALAACGGTRSAGNGFEMGADAAKERARADSLRYPYTKADIDFMMGMIHHHAQAIQISRWAPTHQAGAEVIRLTERIINAQQDEITLMRQWLGDRHQSPPKVDSLGGIEMDHSQHGAHAMSPMPGMLTAEQMAQLDAARGIEFDRLFLTFMIQHHRGAVQMVRELFSNQGAGQDETIFKFAADVEVDQSTEIKRMLQMLITLDNGQRSP